MINILFIFRLPLIIINNSTDSKLPITHIYDLSFIFFIISPILNSDSPSLLLIFNFFINKQG